MTNDNVKQEVEQEVKTEVKIECKCSLYMDKTDDCKNCDFGDLWHNVEGRCVVRPNHDTNMNYGHLHILPDIDEKRKSKKVSKPRTKVEFNKKVVNQKKVEDKAEWV